MSRQSSKRSSYLSVPSLPIGKSPIKIWGYDTSEKFVCRLEITAAGVAIYSGEKGGKMLCDVNWEGLVKKLVAE